MLRKHASMINDVNALRRFFSFAKRSEKVNLNKLVADNLSRLLTRCFNKSTIKPNKNKWMNIPDERCCSFVLHRDFSNINQLETIYFLYIQDVLYYGSFDKTFIRIY